VGEPGVSQTTLSDRNSQACAICGVSI
jgi:hypothetical protein